MRILRVSGRVRAWIVIAAGVAAIAVVAAVVLTGRGTTTRVVDVRVVGTEVTDGEWACRANVGSCTTEKRIAGQVSPPTAFGMSERDVRAGLHLVKEGRYSIRWECRSTADAAYDLKVVNARTVYRIERTETALWGARNVQTSRVLTVLQPLRGTCVQGELLPE